ncbi:MAG TPA: hypothetical protein VE395_02090 [Acidimicrobiales bacterium]|jgi:hypothetical protein|nr:hypothetical protein [Acidimicrobiales bacterium]
MRLWSTVVGGVAAVAAGALPLVGHIPAAGADDFFLAVKTFDYTFDGLDGQPRTCTASGGSGLTRRTGESTFTADSFTSILGEGCTGFTTLSITYRDATGAARSAVAGGDNEVSLTLDGVRDGWAARHGITFDDCAEDCFVTFTTRPK